MEELPDTLVPRRSPWPVVMGVDPGTRATGWGALVEAPDGPRLVACGVVRLGTREPIARRLSQLHVELTRIVARLRPAALAVEGAFYGPNVRTALRLGEARGIALAVGAHAGCEIAEIAPASAKRATTGHGGASKEQVAAMVAMQLGVPELETQDDATDALALALALSLERRRRSFA